MSDLSLEARASIYPAYLFFILLIFAIIFSLISLVNHYLFHTYALDLGVFNHATDSLLHFRKPVFTLGLEGYEISYWGTHFSPITILYTPLYLIFGSYALLLIQIGVILFGGLGVYKYSLEKLNNLKMSLLVLVCFFGMWGIYSALSFDFHNTVIGAMLIPWFIYYYKKKDIPLSILFFVLIISTQENIALWMIFILAGLIISAVFSKAYRNDKRSLYFHLSLLFLSVLYFLIVILILMPHLNQQTQQFHRYSMFGNSFPEIAASIIRNPGTAMKLLFSSSSSAEITLGIKSELHIMVLLAGGVFLLYKPHYLIMLIPVYAQKMLSNDPVLWGINMQYSIEFVPIISLCLVDSLVSLKLRKNILTGILVVVMISTYASNIKTMLDRHSIWYNKTNTVFWQRGHYTSGVDLKELYSIIKSIPGKVTLSASSPLVPHLCNREKIYHFPVVKNAEFIAVLKGSGGVYPLGAEKLKEEIDSLKKDSSYITIRENEDIILLKRINP
jgi:uncharacterized membrane protein